MKTPAEIASARLVYRRVDQSQRYVTTEMRSQGGNFEASIPAEYTDTPFAIQYYFEIGSLTEAQLYPGLKEDFRGQPYFVVEGHS